MPARWLMPGDRILSSGIVCRVARVEVSPGQPIAVTVLHLGEDTVSRWAEVISFPADATVARVTGVHAAGASQGAAEPGPVLL
jgi:hypothetical protein